MKGSFGLRVLLMVVTMDQATQAQLKYGSKSYEYPGSKSPSVPPKYPGPPGPPKYHGPPGPQKYSGPPKSNSKSSYWETKVPNRTQRPPYWKTQEPWKSQQTKLQKPTKPTQPTGLTTVPVCKTNTIYLSVHVVETDQGNCLEDAMVYLVDNKQMHCQKTNLAGVVYFKVIGCNIGLTVMAKGGQSTYKSVDLTSCTSNKESIVVSIHPVCNFNVIFVQKKQQGGANDCDPVNDPDSCCPPNCDLLADPNCLPCCPFAECCLGGNPSPECCAKDPSFPGCEPAPAPAPAGDYYSGVEYGNHQVETDMHSLVPPVPNSPSSANGPATAVTYMYTSGSSTGHGTAVGGGFGSPVCVGPVAVGKRLKMIATGQTGSLVSILDIPVRDHGPSNHGAVIGLPPTQVPAHWGWFINANIWYAGQFARGLIALAQPTVVDQNGNKAGLAHDNYCFFAQKNDLKKYRDYLVAVRIDAGIDAGCGPDDPSCGNPGGGNPNEYYLEGSVQITDCHGTTHVCEVPSGKYTTILWFYLGCACNGNLKNWQEICQFSEFDPRNLGPAFYRKCNKCGNPPPNPGPVEV